MSVPSGGRIMTTRRSRSCVLGPTQITSTSSGISMLPSRLSIPRADCRFFRRAERTFGSMIVLRRNAAAASLRSRVDFQVLVIILPSLWFVVFIYNFPAEHVNMDGQLRENSFKFGVARKAVETRIETRRAIVDPASSDTGLEVGQGCGDVPSDGFICSQPIKHFCVPRRFF